MDRCFICGESIKDESFARRGRITVPFSLGSRRDLDVWNPADYDDLPATGMDEYTAIPVCSVDFAYMQSRQKNATLERENRELRRKVEAVQKAVS